MALIQFGPLEIEVDDRVLHPRSWTLLQSEWVQELGATRGAGPILELCSGAGHIGQAAAMLSGRPLVQVDIDPHACAMARANAARNGLADLVEVRCVDLVEAVRPGERFAIVLGDPPYLPSRDLSSWPGDPALAIDGGPDGLDLLRRCLTVVRDGLDDRGAALLQTAGRRQLEDLGADIEAAGFRLSEVREVDDARAVGLLIRPTP